MDNQERLEAIKLVIDQCAAGIISLVELAHAVIDIMERE